MSSNLIARSRKGHVLRSSIGFDLHLGLVPRLLFCLDSGILIQRFGNQQFGFGHMAIKTEYIGLADKFAVSTSTICALHCIALPFVIGVFPPSARRFWAMRLSMSGCFGLLSRSARLACHWDAGNIKTKPFFLPALPAFPFWFLPLLPDTPCLAKMVSVPLHCWVPVSLRWLTFAITGCAETWTATIINR